MDNIIKDYYKNNELKNYRTKDIVNLIKQQKIKFPYFKDILLTKELVMETFKNLSEYQPNFIRGIKYEIPLYDNVTFFKTYDFKYQQEYDVGDSHKSSTTYSKEYELLVMGKGEYHTYNMISDYYNEKCRMICKRYDKEYSPIDLWLNKPKNIIKNCLKEHASITYKKIRDYFYEYECTTFPPSVLVGMINKYSSTHILDFSSGWGDRLIGSLAAGVKSYCGVDPNPCLHDNYKKIIRDLNHKNTRVTMINSPFETASGIPDEPYDLIFTSPPYFILEQYTSTDENQSIIKHNNIDDWFDKFLLFSLNKAWSYLQVGGYMIINIDNIRTFPDFVGRMIEERSKVIDSVHMGVISFVRIYQGKYVAPRPMWIWKKIKL